MKIKMKGGDIMTRYTPDVIMKRWSRIKRRTKKIVEKLILELKSRGYNVGVKEYINDISEESIKDGIIKAKCSYPTSTVISRLYDITVSKDVSEVLREVGSDRKVLRKFIEIYTRPKRTVSDYDLTVYKRDSDYKVLFIFRINVSLEYDSTYDTIIVCIHSPLLEGVYYRVYYREDCVVITYSGKVKEIEEQLSEFINKIEDNVSKHVNSIRNVVRILRKIYELVPDFEEFVREYNIKVEYNLYRISLGIEVESKDYRILGDIHVYTDDFNVECRLTVLSNNFELVRRLHEVLRVMKEVPVL